MDRPKRTCAETCLELLSIELVHYYATQSQAPLGATTEAIGKLRPLATFPEVWCNVIEPDHLSLVWKTV